MSSDMKQPRRFFYRTMSPLTPRSQQRPFGWGIIRMMNPTGRLFFYFGARRVDGGRHLRDGLGGKGAGLAEMSSLGLPVPPGFTISTRACAEFYARGGRFPRDLRAQLRRHVALLEAETGKRFGDAERPLLLSVRSGAAVSMPGM